MRTSTPPAQRPPWNEKWKSSGCRSRKISISQKTPGFHQIPNLETSLVYTKYDHHPIASVSKSDQRLKPTFWLSSQNLGPWKMDAVLNQRIFRLNTITFKTNLTYKTMLKTTRVESQKRPCGRFRGLIPIYFFHIVVVVSGGSFLSSFARQGNFTKRPLWVFRTNDFPGAARGWKGFTSKGQLEWPDGQLYWSRSVGWDRFHHQTQS